MILNVAAKQDF